MAGEAEPFKTQKDPLTAAKKEMAVTTSSIHLKALSCKDLKTPIPFQKPSIYAVISIGDGGDRSPQKKNSPPRMQQKTPIDRSGGHNPEWNHDMRFDVDLVREGGGGGGLFLELDLFSEGFLLFGDKLVGEVRVPLGDLVAEEKPIHGGSFRTVSYQVKAADGKSGGVLTFTYRTSSPPITLQQQHQYPNGRESPVRYPDLDDILSTGGYYVPPAEAPVGPGYFPPPPPPVVGYYPSFPHPATEPDPAFFYPPPLPPPDPVFYYPPPPPPDPVFHYPPPPEAYGREAWACDCPAYGYNDVGRPQLSDMDAYWAGRTLGLAGTWNGR